VPSQQPRSYPVAVSFPFVMGKGELIVEQGRVMLVPSARVRRATATAQIVHVRDEVIAFRPRLMPGWSRGHVLVEGTDARAIASPLAGEMNLEAVLTAAGLRVVPVDTWFSRGVSSTIGPQVARMSRVNAAGVALLLVGLLLAALPVAVSAVLGVLLASLGTVLVATVCLVRPRPATFQAALSRNYAAVNLITVASLGGVIVGVLADLALLAIAAGSAVAIAAAFVYLGTRWHSARAPTAG